MADTRGKGSQFTSGEGEGAAGRGWGVGALPLPPYSALLSAAAPRPRTPPPAVNVIRSAGHAGSWSPRVRAAPEGARTEKLLLPAGRVLSRAPTPRGAVARERDATPTSPPRSLPPGPARAARPPGSCSWAEGLGRREAGSPTVRELPGWKRGVPPLDRHRDFPALSGRPTWGSRPEGLPGRSRPAAPALSSPEWPGDLGPAPGLSAGDSVGTIEPPLAGLVGFRRAPVSARSCCPESPQLPCSTDATEAEARKTAFGCEPPRPSRLARPAPVCRRPAR